MFKLILVLFVFGALSCPAADAKKQPHRKVLILGAGLSGIVAGKTLMDNGINDFLVLEGQNYIGGRIKQGELSGGYKFEKGANWIQFATDEETAPIWKQKVKNNIKGIFSNYSDIIIRDQTGKDITDLKAAHKLKSVLDHVEEAQKTRKQPHIPARVWLALNGWKPKTPAEYAIEYFEIDFEAAKPPEILPFNSLFQLETDFFVTDQRGVWSLYKDLYNGFKDKILLGKTVKKIDYSEKMVTVTTSNGDVYTADYALSTFSTGVLASDMVQFTPPIPKWKEEAILTMPMGVFTKIFLKFPRKFWDDHEYILYGSKTRGKFPVWLDLQRPGIFPDSGLLMIGVSGDEGRRIERQSFDETKNEIVKMLRGVYGQNIPNPTDIYYERWSLNNYIRGAFSEGVVGVSDETFKNLQKNLGNLHFSGEATSGDWYGYMQGAYFTGKEQASLIAKRLKSAKA